VFVQGFRRWRGTFCLLKESLTFTGLSSIASYNT
jgi:hypothetical protein